jgi:hypothetical protein
VGTGRLSCGLRTSQAAFQPKRPGLQLVLCVGNQTVNCAFYITNPNTFSIKSNDIQNSILIKALQLGCSCPASNLDRSGSNLSQETRFTSLYRNILEYCPKINQNSFLPPYFKFFILSHFLFDANKPRS